LPAIVALRRYEEMHVDGIVTTPIFFTPRIADILRDRVSSPKGANLYMIINGKLASRSSTAPTNTLSMLSRSFSGDMTCKTREALAPTLEFAPRETDARPLRLRGGLRARRAAAAGPEQSIRRNTIAVGHIETDEPACPAQADLDARRPRRRRPPGSG